MDHMLGLVSYGLGTIFGFMLIVWLIYAIIHDVTQKQHTVLRNYPLIGRLRYFFENLGEYFRQYFFAGDRSEMPLTAPPALGCIAKPRTRAVLSALAPPMICASRVRYCL